MKLIIETNLAVKTVWWLLDRDDRVVAGDPASGDRFPSEEAARDAARRVQQQACTAIGQ